MILYISIEPSVDKCAASSKSLGELYLRFLTCAKGILPLQALIISQMSLFWLEPNEPVQSVMPLLSRGIATLLGEIPVYTLDETDMKQMIIKKFARDIKVEKGHIDLIGGIF